ncbi:MAG: hypothetical protein UU08_C0002G0041 [Candidatus Uhrbacteria bacterium GW2011_GWE2_40_58]|nr:MAG: hypothetical protein UT94_C0003G0025 [Candidatus Uhrbacteria bacterium GW2011_GWF2_40_263]KKR68190.1 MAG: hypothetical protein UU08_C0002G0041 [Candidatus Uhrbacteria bacterium GW2011_GWE2_40_58]OGL91906.1 MAG: hypothetical protein A2239_01250 [Candidatus Uhrbacteria bacterium RIFOXYA2_FULL_40_9]OGL97656.1 MAG: hypothetical protein A2332_00700 [Candidatus Uhrbacteria bacterium RIFOXYB2_FULL_41_18]HBK34646.1 hypothetical protein [Candidatus Uhrbacteria bacterium]
MFSPLDILYIVLAFCVLWFTAALFWLIWQVANIFRNVNVAITETREKLMKIEEAISFIRGKFEHATSNISLLVAGISKVVEYAMDKRKESREEQKEEKKQVSRKKKRKEAEAEEEGA